MLSPFGLRPSRAAASGWRSHFQELNFHTPIVAVGLIAFILLSVKLELFEALVQLLRKYERWELDEIVGALFLSGIVAIGMLSLSTRQLRHEIERRKLVETRAVEQAELLLMAQNAAGAGAWSIDLGKGVTTLSPAALKMLGLPGESEEEMGLETWAEFLHPSDIKSLSSGIARAAREGAGVSEEYRFKSKDGRSGWFQSMGRVVDDGSGHGKRLIGLTIDVTERMKAAHALRESEELLRLALEAAGDGAWDWDISKQAISVSDHLVENLGYDIKGFDGDVSRYLSAIHRNDFPRLRKAFTEHLAGRSDHYRCEYRVRTKEKSWRWYLDRGRVVARDPETGRATRMVGTSTDITAFKTAEQQAFDQANLLALAQDGAGAGAWSHDLDTHITSMSPQARKLIGLPETDNGEIALSRWVDLIHPEDAYATRMAFTGAIKNKSDYAAEYRVKQADGSFRWFQSLGRFTESHAGENQRLIGLILDVTDRKIASDALRESEQRLRLALEATGDGAWDWDFDTRQVSRSHRLIERLGYRPEEFGTSADFVLSLMNPDDLPEARKALREYLQGSRSSYQSEYRIKATNGRWHWILDRGHAAARDPVTGRVTRMVGVGTDVTERKEAEIELRRVQGDLIHLSRLSAMGEMASTLAHELNQPLTAMANYARGMRHCVALDGQELLGEAVDGIEHSAERAGEIVRRLREYCVNGELQRRPISLSQVIREACGLALVDAGSVGLTYQIELDERADDVVADKIQIQQVMLNLIRNAVEAMVEGGADRRLIVSSRRCKGKQVEISVTDSGPGISTQIAEQLFTPFVSTKANGMGVGLSICRTIVEAHGGRIWAEPAPGTGNVMRFTLARA